MPLVQMERLTNDLGLSPREKPPSPRNFTRIRLEVLRGGTQSGPEFCGELLAKPLLAGTASPFAAAGGLYRRKKS